MQIFTRFLNALAVLAMLVGPVGMTSAGTSDDTPPHTKEYRSNSGRYSMRYGNGWSLTSTPEPGVDAMLVCNANFCGEGSSITFGVRYDPQTSATPANQILSLANSNLLTAQVRGSPLVSSVTIHEEGRTRLGALPAYQVRMTVRFVNGLVRIRHTFFTFSRGYWYNISLHADPEKYEMASKASQQVLSTFAPF